MKIKDQYFTVSQMAHYMDVTRQTISRWIKLERFPTEKIGREVLVKREDVFDYERRHLGEQLIMAVARYGVYLIRQNYEYVDADEIMFNGIVDTDNSIYRFIVIRQDDSRYEFKIKFTILVEQKDVNNYLDIRAREIIGPTLKNEGKINTKKGKKLK